MATLLLEIGADWTSAKASTTAFIADVRAEIESLSARAGSPVAEGGISPTGLGAAGAQLKADVQAAVELLRTAKLPIPPELTALLKGGLLKELQGIKFPNFGLERSSAAIADSFANTQTKAAVANALAGGAAPDKTDAEKQQARADAIAAQRADEEYVQATVNLATERKLMAATLDEAKAADDAYLQASLLAATTRNLLAGIEDAQKAADDDYLASVVLAAESKNRRTAAELNAEAADADFIESTVLLATAQKTRAAAENRALASSEAYALGTAESAAAKLELANAERAALTVNAAYLDATAEDTITKLNAASAEKETLVANVEYRAALIRAAAATEAETALKKDTGFTKDSSGGGGGPSRPGGFLGGLGSFGGGDVGAGFGSRLASSTAFFASGFLLFGVIGQFRESLKVAENLQVQLAIIQSTMEETGIAGTAAFQSINDKILDVSVSTATAADEVALIGRQLAGVFSDSHTGVPDFAKGLSEAQDALKLSKVSGLPVKEITNDLVAIEQIFDASFKHIGDVSIGLAQRFGVAESDIVTFTSQLAPTAKELGFTFEQIAGLGAVALELSGTGGSQLAEQLRRILPGLQSKETQIADVLKQGGQGDIASSLVTNFAKGNVPGVLTDLINGYDKLDASQKNLLVTTAASSRQQGTLFTILSNGQATLTALGTTSTQYAGDLDKRFAQVKDTVSFAFAQMKVSLQEFAIALFNSGLAKGLSDIAGAAGIVFAAASELLKIFGALNDATGGVAGSIAGLVLGFKALEFVWEKLLALKGASILGGLFGGGGAAAGGAAAAEGSTAIPLAEGFAGASVVGGAVRVGAGKFLAGGSGFGVLPANFGLDALAGEGAIGGQIAGAVAALAPLIGAVAVVELLSTIKKMGNKINDAKTGLEGKVTDLLKAGVSPDEIRQRVAAAGPSDLTLPETIVSFITGQGTDNPIDVANQTIQKYQVDVTKKYLQDQVNIVNEYYKTLAAKSAKDLSAAVGDQGHAYVPNVDPQQLQPGFEGTNKTVVPEALPQDLQGTLDDLLKHPDDLDAKKKMDDLIAAIQANKDVPDAVKQRIASSQAEAGRVFKALQAESADIASLTPDIDNSIATAEAALASGSGSSKVLIDALDRKDAILQDEIKQGLIAGNDISAAVKELAQNLQKESNQIIADLTQSTQVSQLLASLTGGDTPAELVDSARKTFDDVINNAKVLPAAKLKAAEDLATAEQNAFKSQVDNAKTEGEKLALIHKGFKFSDEARLALSHAELLTQSNQNDLTVAASAIGTSVTNLETLVANDMVQFGTDAETIVTGLLKSRLALAGVKSQVDLKIGELTGDLSAYSSDIKDVVSLDNAVKNSGNLDAAAPPTTGNLSANDQNTINQAAISTPQQDANAQLDIEAAQAKNDAVRLAQIAQDRARLDAEFAVTNADRLEAIAHMITADNQLSDAYAAQRKALRSYADILHNNDPLFVAMTAVAQAEDDLARALPNSSEEIAALGALATAQHNAVKALLDRADALDSIDIAKLNEAGDPVGAAQKKLDDLNRRLANAAGAGLNDSEIAGIQAQIIDQTASLAQLQISHGEQQIQNQLTLGKINKQQAIAQLQALKVFAKSQDEITQIDIEIKRLTDALGQDIQFNLPSVLGLPNLYESRRVSQTPGGSGAYQDNRNITVNVYASTQASAADIGNIAAKAVGNPQTSSLYPRRYGVGA